MRISPDRSPSRGEYAGDQTRGDSSPGASTEASQISKTNHPEEVHKIQINMLNFEINI